MLDETALKAADPDNDERWREEYASVVEAKFKAANRITHPSSISAWEVLLNEHASEATPRNTSRYIGRLHP